MTEIHDKDVIESKKEADCIQKVENMSELFNKDIKKEKNEEKHIWELEIQNPSYDNGKIQVKSETDDKTIDHMPEINDKDVKVQKNKADRIWEIEIQNQNYDNGEIKVKKELDDNTINEDANLKTKEFAESFSNVKIEKECVENISDIKIKEEIVESDNDIASFDSLPEANTYDNENKSCESNKSNEINSNTIKKGKDKKIMKRDRTLLKETVLGKEEQITEMKKREESYNYVTSPLKCSSCIKGFLDIDTFNRHMELHSEISEASPHCERSDLSVASQEAYSNHNVCSTKRAEQRTIKIIPSSSGLMVYCGNESANSLRVDLRKYSRKGAPIKKPKADSLNEKNSGKTSNEESLETVTSDAKIPELSKKTDCLEKVKHQAETVVEVDDKNNSLIETPHSISKDKFICDECGRQFDKKNSIIWHLKSEHMQDVSIRNKKSSTLKRHPCVECGRKFRYRHHMREHMKTHTNKNLYTCTVCNKQISRINNYTTHMKTHTEKKQNSCTVCDKQYIQYKSLVAHMRTHTGEKPFTCTVCSKSFSREEVLKTHMKSHAAEKDYSCIVCNKQFSLKSFLVLHMRRHTGERPFSCSVCNMRFFDSSSMTRHKRYHADEKPYICTVCKKGFIDRSYWRKHSIKCSEKAALASVSKSSPQGVEVATAVREDCQTV